jgi:hypothetical protein
LFLLLFELNSSNTQLFLLSQLLEIHLLIILVQVSRSDFININIYLPRSVLHTLASIIL